MVPIDPTSAVEFLHIQVDVADSDSDDALRDMLRRTLRDTARNLVSESAVVRLELTGRTGRRWQVLRQGPVKGLMYQIGKLHRRQ